MAKLHLLAKSLPRRPGVYIFHSLGDLVIYVGKANNLRARVSSYFQLGHQLAADKQIMVGQIKRIEHILVRSETEALLLESTLIKKYRPKYNILLKDDKFFQYIRIALHEPFPSVTTVRKVTLDGSRYFGPYTSGLAVRQTMRLLKRLFPYKSCPNPPAVPCFDYQLGRCLGHSTSPNSRVEYHQVVTRLIDFLDGHTGSVLRDLKQHMRQAAQQRDFERAALLRDRWRALEHILEQQTVISVRRESFDIISVARREHLAAVNLFQVRSGKLVQRDQFLLQHIARHHDAELVMAFIGQYYSQSTSHPRQVYAPVQVPLAIGNGLQIKFSRPQRGLKRKLLMLGNENAEDYLQREFSQRMSESSRARQGLEELAAALKLPGIPRRIEMYDVSNIQGKFPVASMVVFEQGLPKKNAYRKFNVKTIKQSDDVHMLAEVLRRRFQRKSDAGWPWPDLLLLDGGKPQLNTVLTNVSEIPRDMPIAALAKREEEIFIPEKSNPVHLAKDSAGLHFIQQIRDEAHRFAIGFYRRKHRQATTRSMLDEIPGLGPTIKKKLLNKFGTLRGIRQAGDDELRQTIGEQKTALLKQYI